MSRAALCPDCGRVISLFFPIHDCKPTPNFKRAAKKAKRKARRKKK